MACDVENIPSVEQGVDPIMRGDGPASPSTVQYCTVLDHGSRILDLGPWTLDLGPCSGMNDHPGRDTDVRSRPSESTIKDLSFYIGFIRIGSWIKHLGPCFGTNGHFRRDPDTISRRFPSKSAYKNYMESWGQTFGALDFGLQVLSVPASGSEVPRVEKIKIHNSNRSIRGRYQRMER